MGRANGHAQHLQFLGHSPKQQSKKTGRECRQRRMFHRVPYSDALRVRPPDSGH